MASPPAPPRRKRSVNVSALPVEQASKLERLFNSFDKEGKGSISRDDIVPLITSQGSIYDPSEDEVTNTIKYLSSKGVITREDFLMGYHRVVQTLGGVAEGVVGFKEVTKTFNMELHCIAKQGTGCNLKPEGEYMGTAVDSAVEEMGADFVAQVDERFVQLAQDTGSELARKDVATLLKQCFYPGKEKIDLVMNFFDGSDGTVPLDSFMNGMTLLYGDLSLLAEASRRDLQLTGSSMTPLSSPSAMFDGPAPCVVSELEGEEKL